MVVKKVGRHPSRQTLFTISCVGHAKAKEAKQKAVLWSVKTRYSFVQKKNSVLRTFPNWNL